MIREEVTDWVTKQFPCSPYKRHSAGASCRSMTQTYLGFGLAVIVAAAVTVVVRAGISIFMNSVQEPQKEFQGIVLRVSPKLRAILRHCALQRGETLISHFGGISKVIKC